MEILDNILDTVTSVEAVTVSQSMTEPEKLLGEYMVKLEVDPAEIVKIEKVDQEIEDFNDEIGISEDLFAEYPEEILKDEETGFADRTVVEGSDTGSYSMIATPDAIVFNPKNLQQSNEKDIEKEDTPQKTKQSLKRKILDSPNSPSVNFNKSGAYDAASESSWTSNISTQLEDKKQTTLSRGPRGVILYTPRHLEVNEAKRMRSPDLSDTLDASQPNKDSISTRLVKEKQTKGEKKKKKGGAKEGESRRR